MDFKWLASWVASIPVLSAAVDWAWHLINPAMELGDTIQATAWLVQNIVEKWNEAINPLFNWVDVFGWAVSGASAWLLSNKVLSKFDWMEQHKKTKYFLNTLSTIAWVSAWSSLAPVLLPAMLAFYAWDSEWMKKFAWQWLSAVKTLLSESGKALWNIPAGWIKWVWEAALEILKIPVKPLAAVKNWFKSPFAFNPNTNFTTMAA